MTNLKLAFLGIQNSLLLMLNNYLFIFYNKLTQSQPARSVL